MVELDYEARCLKDTCVLVSSSCRMMAIRSIELLMKTVLHRAEEVGVD